MDKIGTEKNINGENSIYQNQNGSGLKLNHKVRIPREPQGIANAARKMETKFRGSALDRDRKIEKEETGEKVPAKNPRKKKTNGENCLKKEKRPRGHGNEITQENSENRRQERKRSRQEFTETMNCAKKMPAKEGKTFSERSNNAEEEHVKKMAGENRRDMNVKGDGYCGYYSLLYQLCSDLFTSFSYNGTLIAEPRDKGKFVEEKLVPLIVEEAKKYKARLEANSTSLGIEYTLRENQIITEIDELVESFYRYTTGKSADKPWCNQAALAIMAVMFGRPIFEISTISPETHIAYIFLPTEPITFSQFTCGVEDFSLPVEELIEEEKISRESADEIIAYANAVYGAGLTNNSSLSDLLDCFRNDPNVIAVSQREDHFHARKYVSDEQPGMINLRKGVRLTKLPNEVNSAALGKYLVDYGNSRSMENCKNPKLEDYGNSKSSPVNSFAIGDSRNYRVSLSDLKMNPNPIHLSRGSSSPSPNSPSLSPDPDSPFIPSSPFNGSLSQSSPNSPGSPGFGIGKLWSFFGNLFRNANEE